MKYLVWRKRRWNCKQILAKSPNCLILITFICFVRPIVNPLDTLCPAISYTYFMLWIRWPSGYARGKWVDLVLYSVYRRVCQTTTTSSPSINDFITQTRVANWIKSGNAIFVNAPPWTKVSEQKSVDQRSKWMAGRLYLTGGIKMRTWEGGSWKSIRFQNVAEFNCGKVDLMVA